MSLISQGFASVSRFFLSDTLTKLYVLYRPYFGFSGENLKRTLAVFFILIFSSIGAISMIPLQNAFSALSITLMQPGVTASLIVSGTLECLLPIALFAGLFSVSMSLTSWLSDNLTFNLQNTFIDKHFDKKFYVGSKFIDSNTKDKKINPSIILGEDLSQICFISLTLFTTFIQAFLNFTVGIYQLGVMSCPLTINVFSTRMTIPGYMVIAAIFYASIYATLVNFLGKNLAEIETDIKNKKDKFSSHLHHIEEHPESIALKNGSQEEKRRLLSTINKSYNTQSHKRKINFLADFLKNVSSNISFLFGLLLSVPAIISGKLEGTHAFSLANYFSSVVTFFTWKKDNMASIVSLEISLKRFQAFHELMTQWDEISKERDLLITHEENHFGFKNLSISKPPHGEPIVNDISISLPAGKFIVLQGPSGIGKTTLFRCLANLWPYVKGEIILPKNGENEETKIYYIPQKAYFPYQGTLLQAICYPEKKISADTENDIVSLMRKLEIKEAIINDRHKKQKWEEILSGGQQQRIAVIGAILAKPKILFIDEGTNGLDLKTEHCVKDALREYLGETTIVAIDHKSEPDDKPFYDYKLIMKESKDPNNPGSTLQLFNLHRQENEPNQGDDLQRPKSLPLERPTVFYKPI